MKKAIIAIIILTLGIWVSPVIFAAEHGGSSMQEHGGKSMHEHGGQALKTPGAADIHSAMQKHIAEKSKDTGTFDVNDPVTGGVRRLKLARIHDRVGKTGDYYYSCADFNDTVSGETLDLDLDVAADKSGKLSVVDVRIHKVDGKERYTYDKDDNRVPVPAEAK